MTEYIQNTIYVLTQGAYLSKDGDTVCVSIDNEVKTRIPIHLVHSLVAFGGVSISPYLMAALAEQGIATTFLNINGRLLCRVDAPASGNVLLRRAQYRAADDETKRIEIVRSVVAGKIQNSRTLLLRAAREQDDTESIRLTCAELSEILFHTEKAETCDALRGYEGRAAERYFSSFPDMLRMSNEFTFKLRTRRPPLDPVNALLSFIYSLLLHDCVAALTSVGLDPSVGFLHTDRPGRPSLALDLMEEFRAPFTDRMAIKLINKRIVKKNGFSVKDGGAVEMDDETRKIVIEAYQERKKEKVIHPLTEEKSYLGFFPFIQARILARCIKGELDRYIPFLVR